MQWEKRNATPEKKSRENAFSQAGCLAEWVAKTKSELEKEGFSPKVTTYNFCTNGSHYAGEAGIRTIGMGPARENLAHTIDEYAEVEDLINVSVCYAGIMKALLG